MLEELKSKSYAEFIGNDKVVASAVDTIQARTGCEEGEARDMLQCEGEQCLRT
jgi:hypothetical protein